MAKRKYSYIIYTDGKRERILNWFKPCFDTEDRTMIALTKDGTYLYRHKHIYPEFDLRIHSRPNYLLRKDYEFLKLKGGVHNVDVFNDDIWYAVEDIDRFEIVMNLD